MQDSMEISMILQKISKKYDKNVVINNFSYDFEKKGLYVLYGASGSGKTTLLNIISGASSFDSGKVTIYDKTYENIVDYSFVKKYISYITQNNYFVDYLTVKENLELCSGIKDNIIINQYLKKFKLEDKINSYPNELSGGEQQRVAIISALLQKKEIILMDEPTSSLDFENKKILIDLLNEMKQSILIICASHDQKLIEQADEVIDFSNLCSKVQTNKKSTIPNAMKSKNKFLFKYMIKNIYYKNREKKSSFYLAVVFVVILLLLYSCFDYQTKIEKGLIEKHGINFVRYVCSDLDNYCDSYLQSNKAIDNIFPYNGNANNYSTFLNYNTTALMLPFDVNLVPNYEDMLLYGSYYENKNDIILGYNVAKKLGDNLEDLINEEYDILLSDGGHEFRIVGILKPNIDSPYLKAMHPSFNLDDYEYLNSKFTEKYKNKEILLNNLTAIGDNSVYMIAFFDNTDDLYKFYNYKDSNIMPLGMEAGFLDFAKMIEFLQYYSYPLIIFAFFIVIIFYFQMQFIINKYREHILSVYNYYGYSWKNIMLSYMLVSILQMVIIFILSFITSIILLNIFNSMNFLEFDLFLIDYKNTLLLFLLLIILSVIFTMYETIKLKKTGWINAIKGGDDLL